MSHTNVMTRKEAEAWALLRYGAIRGKAVFVKAMTAFFAEGDGEELFFKEPVLVRAAPRMRLSSVTHCFDDWMDPFLDLDLILDDREETKGAGSCWTLGDSINVVTGERGKGEITGVLGPLWDVDWTLHGNS